MSSCGIKLRVTAHSTQGGRKYMEDAFVINCKYSKDGKDLDYAFFGVYDGHGGKEAALFAKNNLMDNIVNLKYFWSNDDSLVLSAIRDGFLATHLAMWKELDTWPKTVSGLPSTAGTTASVVFIKNGKLYIGHVGDSKIVLGYAIQGCGIWQAECLTQDHKPDSPAERKRIYNSGGLVMNKSGVERVVWKRPKTGHQGPVRRSTDFDEIPFLAVARSLGDLWSYDYFHEKFVVSPEPDVSVIPLDLTKDYCLILASDGLWNMMTPWDAVRIVQKTEQTNEEILNSTTSEENDTGLCNPSKILIECALERWSGFKLRADNVSVITVMLEPSNERSELILQQVAEDNHCLQTEETNVKNKMHNGHLTQNNQKICHIDLENKINNLYSSSISETLRASTTSSASGIKITTGRMTASPLQALNSLSKYSATVPKTVYSEGSIYGTENNLHPFPRWSKSVTGQTSLSKLACWSKMVDRRRMSDPFPFSNSTSSSHAQENTLHISNTSKSKSDLCTLGTSSLLTNDSKAERLHVKHKVFYTETLSNFSIIKQALKRKYPGIDMSPPDMHYTLNPCSTEITSPWKRKPIPCKLSLTALKAINEYKHSNKLKSERHFY